VGKQVVADCPDVEFVQMAAVRRCDECDQPIAGEADFGASVEVVVLRRQLNPGFVTFSQAAMGGGVEQVVGGDQVLEDGVAKVREVRATERSVPIAAVALAAVEFGAGLVDERLRAGATSALFSVCHSYPKLIVAVCRQFVQSATDHLHCGRTSRWFRDTSL